MKKKQAMKKKLVVFMLLVVLLSGMTIVPSSATEADSEISKDTVLIAPAEETGESADAEKEVIIEPTDESEEISEEPTEEKPTEEKPTEEKPTEEKPTEEKPTEEPKKETKPEKPAKKPKPINLKQPTSLQAIAQKDGIRLEWKKVSKAQKYEVYRKVSGSDSYTLLKKTKELTYKDKTAKYGVTYVYKIKAIATSNGKTYKSKYSPVVKCCTYRIDPSKPMVALTFDDGPSMYTAGILDVLEKYNSRATFFEVGYRVNQYSSTVKRIDKMGCEIGNHSYDHPVLGNASVSKIRSQITTTDAKIKAVTGKTPTLMRPPYGSIGSNLRQNAGKPLILWSIDTLDWKSRNADKVYQSVMSHVSDGDIILMHDAYSSTRDAAKRVIPELRKRGYQLVTVSELAQYRKVTLKAGERYSQMRP